jgi:hypothetical protein
MRICAISDLHGYLPQVPECDLLLIAGDICPVWNHDLGYQANWLDNYFRRWLTRVRARCIVGVAGNHDIIFETRPGLIPNDLPWTYLQDSGCIFGGLKIWGSPWQPIFRNLAFNASGKLRQERWARIPDDTDILVTHCPPFGIGDLAPREGGGSEHCGCSFLLERMHTLSKLKLAVFGHIHDGRGSYAIGGKTLANVTLLNGKYEPVHDPWVYHIAHTRELTTNEDLRRTYSGSKPAHELSRTAGV